MNWSRKSHEPFVYAALGVALTAGFGFGAYLFIAGVMNVQLGAWYGALAQAHGHAQLFGWVGLFILGVGLFFLPRLRGTQLQASERLPWAWGLLVAGIALRCIVQPLSGWMGTNTVLRWLFLLSAVLELAGMVVVATMLVRTMRAAKPMSQESPAYYVEPFVRIGFVSLTLAFVFNLLGAWNVFVQARSVLPARYDQLVITLMLYGLVIPLAIVFSVRTLPLYMRLQVPGRKIWRTLALYYAVGLTLRAGPYLLAIADDGLVLTGRVLRANFVNLLLFDALAVLGTLMMSVCILVAVWQLNLWSKREVPMDRAGYGRFDWLIYSAFVWLVVATILDVVRVLPVVNERILIPQDAARHALMLGFATLLIFGMAPRMLPGFSGKRALAFPSLVVWTFVLGNVAVVLRVLPPILGLGGWEMRLLALSGVVGWLAVLLLAVNLVVTFRGRGVGTSE